MKVSSNNAQGFTLIETCIALVVMMVVGLGATSLFLFALRNNTGGSERSQALAIAQQRLEELRTLRYDDPQLAIGQTVSTVVLEEVATPAGVAAAAAAPSSARGAQAYSSAASGGGAISPSGKPGKSSPTPTPTPGGGGSSTGGGGGEGGYKLVLNVEGLPVGAATPTQKRITITVMPENGYGAASWMNVNPVVIVIHRSSPASGPFRL